MLLKMSTVEFTRRQILEELELGDAGPRCLADWPAHLVDELNLILFARTGKERLAVVPGGTTKK